MSDSLFIPSADGRRVTPTEHARGPWDPGALHGGAPAALIARGFELVQPGGELQIARLGFEFLRPIPFAELTGRASALRIQAVPEELPDPDRRREQPGPEPVRAMPGPGQGNVVKFALNGTEASSLATTGMEMSWLTDPSSLGPGQVWMRLRLPIVPGEEASSLVRLVATADF